MKVRTFIAPLLMALMFLVPAGAGATATTVGTDPAGDWGMGDPDADPVLAVLGDQLGQDLVSAAIEPDGDTVNFIIGVTTLPAAGGVPEFSRYTWDMMVDGTLRELDGKFTNYTRGTCDPTAGTCPPPRDPGTAPFAVRGNCSTTGNVTTCQEVGLVHATFDQATGTITIPVPKSLLPGCEIDAGPNVFGSAGESISAIPAAFVSSSAFPLDVLLVEEVVNVC